MLNLPHSLGVNPKPEGYHLVQGNLRLVNTSFLHSIMLDTKCKGVIPCLLNYALSRS